MKYLRTFENKELEKIIEYHDNGNIKFILYKLYNLFHREDGPAYQRWYKNGKQATELYIINGIYHREDGPAIQKWFENGKIEHEEYYIKGYSYKKEDWINKLKEIKSPHYEEQKILYDMEIYNL